MNRGERKVPLDMACIMVGFAFLFDLTNIVLEYVTFGLGGFVMDIVSIITFSLWFEHYQISLWDNKHIGWTLTASLIDALPIGDLFFPWTIRVASLAFTQRHEASANMPRINAEAMPDHFRL